MGTCLHCGYDDWTIGEVSNAVLTLGTMTGQLVRSVMPCLHCGYDDWTISEVSNAVLTLWVQ